MTTVSYEQTKMDGPPYSATFDEIKAIYGNDFEIMQLEESAYEVPDHLREKGLEKASHAVYLLVKKS